MPRTILVPLIVACALFMENLDSTVLSTSLPAIAADFGESPITLSFAITAYLLSLAVFMPVSGWVADRYGARTVFRAAIVVFTLGSIACGLCGSLLELVFARAAAGHRRCDDGAGGPPRHPAIGAEERARRRLAWFTVPALIGPLVGPPLGGFITTYFSGAGSSGSTCRSASWAWCW